MRGDGPAAAPRAAAAQAVHEAGTIDGMPVVYFDGDKPPPRVLLRLARSPRIEVAIAALGALRFAEGLDAAALRPTLLAQLASPDARLAGVAAQVAERLRDDPRVREALVGLCRTHAQALVRALACRAARADTRALLSSTNPYVVMLALHGLSRSAPADGVYPLLAHPLPAILAFALEWLTRAADPLEAAPGLRAAAIAACRAGLHDPDPGIRARAVAIAWLDRDWAVVDEVLPLLDDHAPNLVRYTYPAIGMAGETTATYESEQTYPRGRGVRAFLVAALAARARAYGFAPSTEDVDTCAAELRRWWAASRARLLGR
jgi:hypothetical protein